MNVLVISAHPDDETLGCGGTLLKHKANGDDIFWAIATKAYEPQWPAEVIKQKSAEIDQVADAYGMKQVFRLGFPSMRLDTVPLLDLIDGIRNAVSGAKPAVVYLVHSGDVHTDHQIVFAAATSVLKPFYMEGLGVRKVLSYETASSTDAAPARSERAFLPTVYSDITTHMDAKIQVMERYASELQSELLPRGLSAIRAWARQRGATIGVEYAEAFSLILEIS